MQKILPDHIIISLNIIVRVGIRVRPYGAPFYYLIMNS